MGWSNEIPNPLVVGGGGGGSGEIDVVDANNNLIMRVNSTGLLMFDSSGNIIGSIAPQFATVNGQLVVPGLGSYDRTTFHVTAQLSGGELFFELSNNAVNVSGELGVVNPNGAAGTAAQLFMSSPTTNADSVSTIVTTYGRSADGTLPAQIQLGKSDSTDCPVLVQGTLNYSTPSASTHGTAEPWHVPTLNANWGTVAGRAPLQYKRTPDGKVTFAGAVQWNNGATAPPITLFTLPAGYQPDHVKELVTRTMPGSTVTPVIQGLQVLTDGTVQITDGPAASFPQSPISFDDVAFYLAVSS